MLVGEYVVAGSDHYHFQLQEDLPVAGEFVIVDVA